MPPAPPEVRRDGLNLGVRRSVRRPRTAWRALYFVGLGGLVLAGALVGPARDIAPTALLVGGVLTIFVGTLRALSRAKEAWTYQPLRGTLSVRRLDASGYRETSGTAEIRANDKTWSSDAVRGVFVAERRFVRENSRGTKRRMRRYPVVFGLDEAIELGMFGSEDEASELGRQVLQAAGRDDLEVRTIPDPEKRADRAATVAFAVIGVQFLLGVAIAATTNVRRPFPLLIATAVALVGFPTIHLVLERLLRRYFATHDVA
ncbi:MAG: hypothetical protein AAGF12_20295 [Myxococcota bacterium]